MSKLYLFISTLVFGGIATYLSTDPHPMSDLGFVASLMAACVSGGLYIGKVINDDLEMKKPKNNYAAYYISTAMAHVRDPVVHYQLATVMFNNSYEYNVWRRPLY